MMSSALGVSLWSTLAPSFSRLAAEVRNDLPDSTANQDWYDTQYFLFRGFVSFSRGDTDIALTFDVLAVGETVRVVAEATIEPGTRFDDFVIDEVVGGSDRDIRVRHHAERFAARCVALAPRIVSILREPP